MANVKRSSTSGDTTASKAGKTTKKKSNKSAPDPTQDGKVSIFVRISQDAKNILDKAAELSSMPNVRVIERLLENFEEMGDPKLQRDILRGTYSNPIKDFEDWQASLSWAQHAYDNDRFILAAKLYKPLSAGTGRSKKFINLCNYKLGLCWMGIASELRNEALLKKSEANDYQLFRLALRVLDEAIDYTKKVEEDQEIPLFNLIMHYNLACCYSMKAQYLVEDKMDLNEAQITTLRRATDDSTAAKEVWDVIGKKWRGDDKRRDIDFEAQKALDELQEIFPLSSSESSLSPLDLTKNSELLSDIIWLVEAALKDEDLIFLRTDEEKWQPEFKKWSDSALRGNRSIADTVRDLLNEK